MPPDLTEDDLAILAELLRGTIAADRFQLSQRIRSPKAILAKLDPGRARTESEPQPLAQPGKRVEPSWRMARKRRR